MMQERGLQSQSSQINNDERVKVLRQLQEKLNPFREGLEAERFRSLGLYNFYIKMSDPSLEYIEDTYKHLSDMPLDNIQQLYSATTFIEENPERFFNAEKIKIEDPKKLREGLINSDKIMMEIFSRYDFKTKELRWGESSNPRAIAEDTYERIQQSKGERQLNDLVWQIANESNLQKQHKMGLKLKRQVLDYVNNHSFKLYKSHDRDSLIEPTWENLTLYPSYSVEFETKGGSTIGGGFGIEDSVKVAQAAIDRYEFEKKLNQLPKRDKEQFNQLRLQYGAKAANLLILSGLVKDINKVVKKHFDMEELAVPEFKAVPVEFYKKWKEGILTDNDLRPYFEWVNGLKEKGRYDYEDKEHNSDYIVRSSAVFSEDGEKVTGAGVYESVQVYGGKTFKDFKNAIVKVYESTNSPQAQAYREKNGIDKEEMGLIIQRYVTSDNISLSNQSYEGYVNSKLPGVPQLMEIVTRTSRNFIKRKELNFYLTLRAFLDEDTFRTNVHYFPPDIYKVNPALLVKVAQFTSVLERIWGENIQIEFVEDGLTMNCVQVRDIPTKVSPQTPEIKFPDEEPIHCNSAIGMGDLELDVLDDEKDNSEKTGVVLFTSNELFSMGDHSYLLPKKGGVIICNYNGRHGHIQTLCAEKGLMCIFPGMNEGDKPNLRYDQLLQFNKIRMVVNGIEGRVYKVEDKSTPKTESM
jgi:hypothetical protein